MKDKCIIKTADKPCGNCLIRVNPSTHRRVLELASKTNRSITSIASQLVEFALDRVEIEYQFKDQDMDPDQEQLELQPDGGEKDG